MIACPRCRSTDVTAITIDLRAERDMNFYSCRTCEEKWWERDGERIGLTEVVELSATTGRRRRSST